MKIKKKHWKMLAKYNFQDAMRYRWLRDTQNSQTRNPEFTGDGCIESITVWTKFNDEAFGQGESPHGFELDAIVDEAMKRWPICD